MRANIRLLIFQHVLLVCVGCDVATEDQPGIEYESRFKYEIITTSGGRLSWLGGAGHIAFDQKGDDGKYDVWEMAPDGSDEQCLTCDHPDLPETHIGQPGWHPSGKYIVVQVEKAEHPEVRFEHVLTPGAGSYNDLWILNIESGQAATLYTVPNLPDYGVLHPHFSKSGTQLSWSKRYRTANLSNKGEEIGAWSLMYADVVEADGLLSLRNVTETVPGAEGFYENHGYSPDGTSILFTSNFYEKIAVWKASIFSLDLGTGEVEQLTRSDSYDEHATYSYDGNKIAWMNGRGIPRGELNSTGGTEYWIMDRDGENKQQVTFFNDPVSDVDPDNIYVMSDVEWSADNRFLLGHAQLAASGLEIFGESKGPEWIIKIELPEL